jgi:hypothetical protein
MTGGAPDRRQSHAGVAGLVALALMLAAGAASEPVAAQERKPGDVTASASVTGFSQIETDLSDGGNFRLEGSVTWQLSRQFSAGVSLR